MDSPLTNAAESEWVSGADASQHRMDVKWHHQNQQNKEEGGAYPWKLMSQQREEHRVFSADIFELVPTTIREKKALFIE